MAKKPRALRVDSVITAAASDIDSADLALTKTGDKNPVQNGDVLTYTLTVVNNGPNDAQNVIVTDEIPFGLNNQQYSTDGGTTWVSWSTFHSMGTLANGVSSSFLIRGTVNDTVSGTIENVATVFCDTSDPDLINNIGTAETTVGAAVLSADLALAIKVDKNPVQKGDVLTYTITVVNNGPSDAQDVVVTDEGPSSLNNQQYSTDGGITWMPWNTSRSIGTLANGVSSSFLIRGTVNDSASGTIENMATVTSGTHDSVLHNNFNTVETTVGSSALSADLTLVIKEDKNLVQAGDVLTYTITVVNNGSNDAQGVVVSDSVPDDLTGIQYSTDAGATWQTWNGSYSQGTLSGGASFSILLRGTVGPSASGVINNTAIVSSTTPDPNLTNNSSTSTVNTTVTVSADLIITKTGDKNPVQAGDILTYRLTVVNNGPDAAQDVIVTDVLSSELTGEQYSTDGGATWQTWNSFHPMGTLASGESGSFLIRGTVNTSASGIIENTATVNNDVFDPNRLNNVATVETTVSTPDLSADLAIVKNVDKNPVQVNDVLTYTLAVTNNGPDAAQTVTVTDTIPDGLTGVEYSTDGGAAWQAWNGSYSQDTLINGATVHILLRGTVSRTAGDTISNTATVNSITPDSNSSNNTSTVITMNNPSPISCEDAVNQIISSIALEELGISHILNAEGDKLQHALSALSNASGTKLTTDQVIKINDSVLNMLKTAANMQMLLASRLSEALSQDYCNNQEITGSTSSTN